MHIRNAYVIIDAITNSISDFCLSIATWEDEICSRMANWERVSAIRRHVFHVDAKEYACIRTRGGLSSLGRDFLLAARLFDSAGTAQASSPPCMYVHTRLASFNRTKLRVITCKRALKHLRFKGIRRPMRVVLMHIRIYIRVCAFVYAGESARERNYACKSDRCIGERTVG